MSQTLTDRVTATPPGAVGPPVFKDGFGLRFLGFDAETGDPVEILSFDRTLVANPDFGSNVGVRVARLSGARHTLFARVRRIDRPTPDSLLLVSDRVAGWRLAEVLDIATRVRLKLDISAVLNLLRQLVPAVALFGRHQRDLSVGNIAPERLILTPQGRLVLAEFVLGDAIEKLSLARDDLWRSFRVSVASGDDKREGPRSDVVGIGVVALTLLLGRRLREDEFPFALSDLIELVTELHEGEARSLSPGLASWLARSLQLEGHKPLQSPKEAQVAFEELLATERGYVTSPAMLERFIAQYEEMAGPPQEVEKPEVEEMAAPPRAAVMVGTTQPSPQAPAQEHLPPLAPTPQPSWAPQPTWAPTQTETSWQPPVAPTLVAPPLEIERHEVQDIYREPSPSFEPPRLDSSPSPKSEAVAPPPAVKSRETEATPVVVAPVRDVSPLSYAHDSASDESSGWMKKALAALVVLALVEAAALAWLWTRSAGTLSGDGELTIQSRPVGARVTLDDDDLGVTPVTVRRAPGTYTLKVRVGNAEPRVIPVQVRSGVQTAQYLELQGGK